MFVTRLIWAVAALALVGAKRENLSFYVDEILNTFVGLLNGRSKFRSQPARLPDFEENEFTLKGVWVSSFQNWTQRAEVGQKAVMSGDSFNDFYVQFSLSVDIDFDVDNFTTSFYNVPLSVFVEEVELTIVLRVSDVFAGSCSVSLKTFRGHRFKGLLVYFNSNWLPLRNAALSSHLDHRFMEYLNANLLNPTHADFFRLRFEHFLCQKN